LKKFAVFFGDLLFNPSSRERYARASQPAQIMGTCRSVVKPILCLKYIPQQDTGSNHKIEINPIFAFLLKNNHSKLAACGTLGRLIFSFVIKTQSMMSQVILDGFYSCFCAKASCNV